MTALLQLEADSILPHPNCILRQSGSPGRNRPGANHNVKGGGTPHSYQAEKTAPVQLTDSFGKGGSEDCFDGGFICLSCFFAQSGQIEGQASHESFVCGGTMHDGEGPVRCNSPDVSGSLIAC